MGKQYSAFSDRLFRLDGKVAMITGGNTGLGMAYAIALSKMGADIFVPHFIPDVTEVRNAVEANGRRIAFLQGDLLDDAYRKACVQACMREFGRIDILINNAGKNYACPLIDMPNEKWLDVVKLQLEAVQFMSHEVIPVMKAQGYGKIINIASALSFAADMNASAYTAAKHGVVGITRSHAAELGKYGIRCNAIAPGFFLTPVNADVRESDPALFQKVAGRLPLNDGSTWGDIFDLMGPVVFLASPASDYVTGDVLVVDGGFRAQMV